MLCVTSGQPHFGWLLRRCSPLPISNREVKPACADGTAMQCGRVGSCPFYQEAFGRISFQRLFCVLWKWNTKNIVVYLLLFAKPFLSKKNRGLPRLELSPFVTFVLANIKPCNHEQHYTFLE